MAAGNLDNSSRDDLVIDFGSVWGLWTFRNGTTWSPLHPQTSGGCVLADRGDGSGMDEEIVDFGAAGLWQYWNDCVWSQLRALNPEGLTTGRFR